MKNNIIELYPSYRAEAFDYAECNRRAKIRFRSSEIRAWILHLTEVAVTAAIGICTLFCMYLTITML